MEKGCNSTVNCEIMKKYFLLLITFSFLFSCSDAIEKPENLIEKEKMDDIIYDLTLLQAMRGSFQGRLDSANVTAADYIYKKYNVDSSQFANSNRYYASDVAAYNRMYNRVNERLVADKSKADSLAKKAEERLKLEKEKTEKDLKKTDSIKK